MDALFVTLKAVDTLELLIAVGTSPNGLVGVGEKMATEVDGLGEEVVASSVWAGDGLWHAESLAKDPREGSGVDTRLIKLAYRRAARQAPESTTKIASSEHEVNPRDVTGREGLSSLSLRAGALNPGS